ncbi:MAG TPA: RDD family protein [Dongiaceae bacterium]|nr:RDD family protein [Dongiaceae bacterium]
MHLTPQPLLSAPAQPVSPHWLPPPISPYAGFWLRFVAHLVDGVVVGIFIGVIIIPIFLLTGVAASFRGLRPDGAPDPAVVAALVSSIALIAGASFLLGWLYNAYFESSDWQGTVGKKILNIKVTDLNGNRISFGRATGRFFSKFISGLIPLGIGYIMAGFTERKQALHDMIASCLVLRA